MRYGRSRAATPTGGKRQKAPHILWLELERAGASLLPHFEVRNGHTVVSVMRDPPPLVCWHLHRGLLAGRQSAVADRVYRHSAVPATLSAILGIGSRVHCAAFGKALSTGAR